MSAKVPLPPTGKVITAVPNVPWPQEADQKSFQIDLPTPKR